MQPFVAVLSHGEVVVPAQSEADSMYNDGYGEREKNAPLRLKPCETLFNVERGKLSVVDEASNEKQTFQDLLVHYTALDTHVWTRFIVYRDLRLRGFVAQAVKGETDFIVYERGMYRKEPPKYLVKIISEGQPEDVKDMLDALKESESCEKELKLAVVDRRGEILYYGLSERRF
ncbi:hypothetical protein JXL21_07255 [Candidatus Bathyarchaeota archaeon]|nr:hypothetical protein [Candidatus Bathyarchaeota archaeon]